MYIIIFILISTLLSAFFSGAEIAFVSANKLNIEVQKSEGNRKARILGHFYDNPKTFIISMLVGNNISLVILTYFFVKLLTPLFAPFISSEIVILLINTLIITLFVLIFGEFLPKTFFRLFADRLILFLAVPIMIFKWLLSPFTWLMNKLSQSILKHIFKISADSTPSLFSKVDLEFYIKKGLSEGSSVVDKDILTNALQLEQQKVKDCMVPRNEIVHIDIDSDVKELIDLFVKSKHSRILVSDGDIEEIKGYIHHQHILFQQDSIRKHIIELDFVPSTMSVKDLMSDFIKTKSNMAIVVDEYGGIAGLITMEDILEEIFGEIEDEHDVEEYIEKTIGPGEYLFSGRLEIDYLNEKYVDLNIPEGEYNTLSGYIVMTNGKIPEGTDTIEMENYIFTLESVSDTKIETVRVKVIKNDSETKEP